MFSRQTPSNISNNNTNTELSLKPKESMCISFYYECLEVLCAELLLQFETKRH